MRRFCPLDAVWVSSQPSALRLSSPTRKRLFAFLGVAAVKPPAPAKSPFFFFFLPPAPIGHGERGGGCSQRQTLTGRRGRIGREGTHMCSSTRGRALLFFNASVTSHPTQALNAGANSFLPCLRQDADKQTRRGRRFKPSPAPGKMRGHRR